MFCFSLPLCPFLTSFAWFTWFLFLHIPFHTEEYAVMPVSFHSCLLMCLFFSLARLQASVKALAALYTVWRLWDYWSCVESMKAIPVLLFCWGVNWLPCWVVEQHGIVYVWEREFHAMARFSKSSSLSNFYVLQAFISICKRVQSCM